MSRILEIHTRKVAEEIQRSIQECSESAVSFGYECCKNDVLAFVDERMRKEKEVTHISIADLLQFLRQNAARQRAKEIMQTKV